MISVGITGFIVMVGLMLVGLPIGAVMLLVGLAGGMMAFGMAFLNSAASVAWGTMSENGLTAIPLFVLLGEFLLRSGMADRMYTVFAVWLGRLPGGLLHTNIGCCALFAAPPAPRSQPPPPSERSRCPRSSATAIRCPMRSAALQPAARSAS
jgi:TRAP-type mannitol/chloroaromatic compound transport system permease large subunit